MKTKVLITLSLLFAINFNYAQIKIEFDEDNKQLSYAGDRLKDKIISFSSYIGSKKGEPILEYERLKQFKDESYYLDSAENYKLKWEIDDSKIYFHIEEKKGKEFKKVEGSTTDPLHYCEKDEYFYKEPNKCKDSIETLENPKSKYSDITQINYPVFDKEKEDILFSKRDRYIIIDASADYDSKSNVLVSKRKGSSIENSLYKEAKLDVKGAVSIFIKNFNKADLEDINVKIEDKIYTYDTGLQEILNEFLKSGKKSDKEGDATNTEKNEARLEYLENALVSLNENKKLSLDNFKIINKYKSDLIKTIQDNGIVLSQDAMQKYSELLAWTPNDLLVTTFPIGISDGDEINITLETKTTGEEKYNSYKLKPFRTTGGLSFNTGGHLYYTGLKNNSVFTETVEIEDQEELRAFLEDDNQSSIGIGINTSVGFRTGASIFPTFNVGFFVPFEEEITPFIAVGPGFTVSTSLGELAFASGLAFGKVNVISERYENIDLTDLELTNENLTSKAWETSFFVSVGINFLKPKKE